LQVQTNLLLFDLKHRMAVLAKRCFKSHGWGSQESRTEVIAGRGQAFGLKRNGRNKEGNKAKPGTIIFWPAA
jgi:hypothetical protein